MKRKIILAAAAIVALLVIGWGVSRWNYGRTHVSTDNA